MCRFIYFIKFGKFSAIIFQIFFFSSPTKIPIMCMRVHFRRFDLSLGSVHFPFSFLFLFLRLNDIHWPVWSLLIILSAQVCSWTFLVKFSFQLLLFSTKISIWFLLIIYISLLIFFIWWDSFLMICFRYLYVVSFSSLDIFKILDLKSLFNKSDVWASSGVVSINFFFPFYGLHFHVFFVQLVIFCWKLDILNIII